MYVEKSGVITQENLRKIGMYASTLVQSGKLIIIEEEMHSLAPRILATLYEIKSNEFFSPTVVFRENIWDLVFSGSAKDAALEIFVVSLASVAHSRHHLFRLGLYTPPLYLAGLLAIFPEFIVVRLIILVPSIPRSFKLVCQKYPGTLPAFGIFPHFVVVHVPIASVYQRRS